MTNPCNGGFDVSVPAVSRWRVAMRKSGKLAKWIRLQSFRGRCRRSSDVNSTARSRYSDTMPNATAEGFHVDANGTSTSTSPKCT
jgi:hypothetical protein